jgi:2-oxoglutarate ferredoxin oxidoreductase subunit gamma
MSLSPGGTLIIDPDLVSPANESNPLSIRATHIAEKLGVRIVANMVILGFFANKSEIVSLASLNKAVETTVRPNTLTINLKAIASGYEYATAGESIL